MTPTVGEAIVQAHRQRRWMSYHEATELAHNLHAQIVEVVHCKGAARLNVVLRNGRPQTWKATWR